MKSDKTFSGVTPDYGTIMRVNTRVTSEKTAALQEQLSIYDSAYLGGHLRPVRKALFIDRPLFGLSMMENNIPAVQLAFSTALDSFKPHDSLVELDAVLDQMGGSARAPSLTIIPCTTVLATGYKFAENMIQASKAWYQDRASWQVGGGKGCDPLTSMDVYARNHNIFSGSELPANAPYVALGRVEVTGMPTRPAFGFQPYREAAVILLPIAGQGPGVFLAGGYEWATGETDPKLASNLEDEVTKRYTYRNVIPLRWALFYQEADEEIDSPVKKLFMIAFLAHLFRYLDGDKLRLSQYHWPTPSGTPSPSYDPHKLNYTGHDFLNRLMGAVVRAAALRLEYKEAEELPSSIEMQLIRALANLCYFLDHRDLLLRALMNTSSMRQFCTLLLESRLMQEGAHVEVYNGGTASPMDADLQLGVAPVQATTFLFDQVMTLLPQDIFDLVQVAAAGGPLAPILQKIFSSFANPTNDNRGKEAYQAMRRSLMQGFADLLVPKDQERAAYEMNLGANATELSLDPGVTQLLAQSATEFARVSVKNMSTDMRSDYIASALLMRFRESLPVVISLLKGEIPGFEHIHVDSNQDALSAEVTLDILESIQLMVDRDLLATKDCLQWEEPYAGAHFSTAWQSFALRFPLYPIPYVVHDLACDYLHELEAVINSGFTERMPADTATTVSSALATVGLTLIQCEPAMTYLPLGGDQRSAGVCRTYMAGELEACGRRAADPSCALYGDVSPAHGALRVTSVYYIRSATIWNQLMEMPRLTVARAYNPQPVPRNWHTLFRMTVDGSALRRVLHHASDELVQGLLPTEAGVGSFSHWIDPNPAFRDVGIVLPYVGAMVQTPPEAYAFTMMSKIEYDAEQRVCTIAGSPIVPLQRPEGLDSGIPDWAVPNLSTQMAYQAKPVTHMILPLIWNAVR